MKNKGIQDRAWWKWYNSFYIAALILSHVMCIDITRQYVDMIYGIQYKGYSAPASVVFIFCIPYTLGIVICLILYKTFRIRDKQ